MKRKIKRIIKRIKECFSKKISVPIPILQGNFLDGRVALITGGTSGIGFEIAKSFLNNNASVIIVGRNIDKLNKAIKELEREKKEDTFVKGYILDVSSINEIEYAFNNIIEDLNGIRIDILVNNAGINVGDSIGRENPKTFEQVIKTNLEGTFFLSQIMYNYMKNNKIKGNILNVSSSSAIRPAITAYGLSKWAINGLTMGMAKKFIQDEIVVNAIAPGPTATDMLNKVKNDDISKSNSMVGRFILPEEVANIATILVSQMGRMIIGETIYITGGAGNLTLDDIEY